MGRILLYSYLLVAGMVFSQLFNLQQIELVIVLLTLISLSYIMIEVGLEFSIDKSNLSGYGKDFLIAMSAAILPWLFCGWYFYNAFDLDLHHTLLLGRFAAPTSAGVLFVMLSAAGLGMTWLFNKARVLAIFDDLFTIVLVVPIQLYFSGFTLKSVCLIVIIFLTLGIAYLFLHRVKLPVSRRMLLLYAVGITAISKYLKLSIDVELEVLLPSFAWGCLLYNPHNHQKKDKYHHEHAYIEPLEQSERKLDMGVKILFMFLVGCSLPKVELVEMSLAVLLGHVVILTVLSNAGKLVPAFCYKKEASLRERIALSIAMFPRGEVGAGVLVVALGYGIQVVAISVGALSLALNLVLTGLFILMILKIIRPVQDKEH